MNKLLRIRKNNNNLCEIFDELVKMIEENFPDRKQGDIL